MQGFNMGRYVPPDLEGVVSGNKLVNKHPLGSRARKSSQGILTVRFEMPYAIWCTTCPRPTMIPQGVRFNAEKKRVGSYYSTPIYAFRMKHTACGGWVEIRTDPKNTIYVVTEGAKKRDYAEDKVREGEEGMVILTEEERERRRNDAFASLEGKVQDKRQAHSDANRIEGLLRLRERDWDDTDNANRRLRGAFRRDRKIGERKEKDKEALKARLGTEMEILDELEEDGVRAGMVDFGEQSAEDGIRRAGLKALFPKKPTVAPSIWRPPDRKGASAELLRQKVKESALAAVDPFTIDRGEARLLNANHVVHGIKRKELDAGDAHGHVRSEHRTVSGTEHQLVSGLERGVSEGNARSVQNSFAVTALVDYESD